tara:strand:+ start:1951 stop:2424 length:474 start_codon:yes stop_codon:yes gene_type:complete
MNLKLIKEVDELKKVCSKVVDFEEAEVLAKEMLLFLKQEGSGVGLAANQVGHDKQVCVINVSGPVILINPKITSSFKKIMFNEGCLSYPGDNVVTERYANIAVTADNHSEMLYFSEDNLLESVCVQHEIDHLNGITMHDRKIDLDKRKDSIYDKGVF